MKWHLGTLALAGVIFAAPLHAQETRVSEQGFESPAASIADAEWLVGQWSGAGIEGAKAQESWLTPTGNTMVGTFVQQTAEGAIMFTEHMYLTEEGGSLVVKLKHFNADLTAWEDKGGMVTFRLLSMAPCALYFNALTYRCVDSKVGPSSGLVVAVRMKSDKPEPQELVFRFKRQAANVPEFDDCGAMTTGEYNACFSARADVAAATRDSYLAAAREVNSHDPETVAAINKSERTFAAHMEAECNAIWSRVREGTIRTSEYLLCEERMLRRRAHAIWKDWLGRPFTEEVLPEPELP